MTWSKTEPAGKLAKTVYINNESVEKLKNYAIAQKMEIDESYLCSGMSDFYYKTISFSQTNNIDSVYNVLTNVMGYFNKAGTMIVTTRIAK